MSDIDLFLGNSLEFMKMFPDKYFDLVFTDPPYGKNADKGTNGFGVSKNRRYAGGWDSKRPPKEYFDEMFRIGKNVIIFGANYFADMLPPSNHWIFWDKKGEIKFQNPFADGELIYTTFKKPVKKIVFKQQGFITDSKDKRYHPTQKPTELLTQIILEYTPEQAKIIDPFMGSGSTGVSCVQTGRDFVGIDNDAQIFLVAKQRIQEAQDEGN